MAPYATHGVGVASNPCSSRALSWDAVVAGALTAAALAFVLHAFAAAIGIAVSSASPTWRDYSVVLQVLSGLYLVLVAIISLGCGGYSAGRLRETVPGSEEEIEFRDGAHGIAVWALARCPHMMSLG